MTDAPTTDVLDRVEPLIERQRQLDRLLEAEGAGHLVGELMSAANMPWRLDPLPLLLDRAEFDELADAVAQRTRVLELVLRDLYGERELLAQGAVPAEVLYSLPGFRLAATRHGVGRHLVHHACDVVRTASGRWRVVQDVTDSPTGLGFALVNRAVMARVAPDELERQGAASLAGAAAVLRGALGSLAPAHAVSPRTVVLTPGVDDPAYVEHSYLALQMGVHLAEVADLVVRRRRLWLRTLGGLEPVDVVYRRVLDGDLDPLESSGGGGRGGAGVPALTWAVGSGDVRLGNSFGAGVVEQLGDRLDDASQALTGESLRLARLMPGEALATVPVYHEDPLPRIEPGHVVVRLHALVDASGVHVLPGGAGRVVRPDDDLREPTARRTKDVWVTGSATGRTSGFTRRVIVAPPQIDLGTSVPTRVADAFYTMGRAAERAEFVARTVRVVATQVQQDAGLVAVGDGAWAEVARALVGSACVVPVDSTAGHGPSETLDLLRGALDQAAQVLAAQLATLVHEGSAVRSFLPPLAGRVLGRLAEVRADIVGSRTAVDELDSVLVDLAALSGLLTESTVRSGAWRFGDLGRRIERAVALVGSVEAGLGPVVDELAVQPTVEAVLSMNESLIAYRRRYRSEVELDAVVELLVRDPDNPRSLTHQVHSLDDHVRALGWDEGIGLVDEAGRAVVSDFAALGRFASGGASAGGRREAVDAAVLAVRAPLLDLGAAVVRRWFADPVDPVEVRGR